MKTKYIIFKVRANEPTKTIELNEDEMGDLLCHLLYVPGDDYDDNEQPLYKKVKGLVDNENKNC